MGYMYTQDCHYGFERPHKEEYDEIEASENKTVVECHNTKCREFYCKFNVFSGGQIPDSECEFFMKNVRDQIK